MSEILAWLAQSGLLQPLPPGALADQLMPQVAVIAAILLTVGTYLKKWQKFPDDYIPAGLFAISMTLCYLLMQGTADLYTIIFQAVLATAVAVSGNQLKRQSTKRKIRKE